MQYSKRGPHKGTVEGKRGTVTFLALLATFLFMQTRVIAGFPGAKYKLLTHINLLVHQNA